MIRAGLTRCTSSRKIAVLNLWAFWCKLSLTPSQSRCRQDVLELELVHALSSPKRAASPPAQVRQLRAELEAAEAEIVALQSMQSKVRWNACSTRAVPVRSFLALLHHWHLAMAGDALLSSAHSSIMT